MKKLVILSIVLMAFPLAVLAQDPVFENSIEQNTILDMDSLLSIRFPNGSIPYPSEEAHFLLANVIEPAPRASTMERMPKPGFEMWMEYFPSEQLAFNPTPKELNGAVQWLIYLTFCYLSIFDEGFNPDWYYYGGLY